MNYKRRRKELLIAVTYGKAAVKYWLETQLNFIRKFTDDFDFSVFLHEIEDETPFKNHIIIDRMDGVLLDVLPVMFKGILEFFRANKNYNNYLLLDSDCFPVTENWLPRLIAAMGDRWYAAPLRADNLDSFPHPCGLFIKDEHVNENVFNFNRFVKTLPNFLGEKVGDIGTAIKQKHKGKHIFFPLVRTNLFNPHPIMSAIYGNTFYHHGAGSRHPYFRSTSYYNKICPEYYGTHSQCHDAFRQDPEGYIRKLRGEEWHKVVTQK